MLGDLENFNVNSGKENNNVVLVTGATGFIGKNIVYALLNNTREKYKVIASVHSEEKAKKLFENYIDRDNLKIYVGDMGHENEIEENIDYIVLANSGENPAGGRPKQEYIISLEMAKELSMVERNEKGKEARKYFIECEKIAKGKSKPLTTLEIMAQSVKILQDHEAKMLVLESKQNDIDSKILEIESKISTSNSDYYSVSGYASLKGFKHLDIRRANLIGRLAAKLSREYGIDIGKVKDERYGNVNIYHIDILHEAFNRKI